MATIFRPDMQARVPNSTPNEFNGNIARVPTGTMTYPNHTSQPISSVNGKFSAISAQGIGPAIGNATVIQQHRVNGTLVELPNKTHAK